MGEPEPTPWPEAVLTRETEKTLALASLESGIDYATIALHVIFAASAAAPKNARFQPYGGKLWTVPPIIWLMNVARSGQRKTAINDLAFAPLGAADEELWEPYRQALDKWYATPVKERGVKPKEPHSYLVDDVTPEKLGTILGRTSRGTAMVKDELAGLFEFGRYRQGGGNGEAARAFYLSAYEDRVTRVHRLSRDSERIKHSGVAICGNIQPARLEQFEGLESDGLLQRFIINRQAAKKVGCTTAQVGDRMRPIHDAIRFLCHLDGRHYTTTEEGEQTIRATEAWGDELAKTVTDYGAGWQGFCDKLHGTHARLALCLHLLEAPREEVISTECVYRAERLVRHYIIQHAEDFYGAALKAAALMRIRDIAGWILTRADALYGPLERFLASDVTHNVKSCRPLGSKGVGEALDPFVVNGWLEPESPFPNNRAWTFNPLIRRAMTDRIANERQRRADVRALLTQLREPPSSPHV